MTQKGFKFIHVNTRSIIKKVEFIKSLYENVDIICCSETWLDNRICDSLVKIDGMNIFRCDRKNDIVDYNIHVHGGGVCIYVSKKWADFAKNWPEYSITTDDFEIISITICRPNFKKLFIACVYKPPKGKIENFIKYMSNIIQQFQKDNYEIWILGDFNTDLLKRDNTQSILLNRFVKKYGLSHQIENITRPNIKGGSCLDLIMTDCPYIQESGILNDFVSDHYTVFSIRKKQKEYREIIRHSVRDYRAFNEEFNG